MRYKRIIYNLSYILWATILLALAVGGRQTALNAAPVAQGGTLQALWSEPVNVSNSANRSQQPRLQVVADNVHIAWTDVTADERRLCYAARGEGDGWQITEQPCPTEALVELVTAYDALGVEHALWTAPPEAGRAYDVFYTNRAEGSSWSPALNLSRNTGWSRSPQIEIGADGSLHVVWYDNTPGNDEVFYTIRAPDGSWLEPLNISHNAGQSRFPRLALGPGGEVHTVWQDNTRGVEDILYAVRLSNGTWSEPITAWVSAQGARASRVAVGRDAAVHIVWQDAAQGTEEVFYIALIDGAWSPPVNVSRNAGRSVQPRVAVDSQLRVHVVWQDDTLGYPDIFYARGVSRLPTPTPTNTPIFSPTPTNTPTNTPRPTPTNTPTPTPGALTFPFREPRRVKAYYDLQYDKGDAICTADDGARGYCAYPQSVTSGLVYDAAHRPGVLAQIYRETVPWHFDNNWRWGHTYNQHNGTDYEAPAGAPVLAAADGIVIGVFDRVSLPEIQVAAEFSHTNWIVLYHPEHNLWTAYLHIASHSAVHYDDTRADGQTLPLKVGDRVWRGQIIATTNTAGESSYLHFGVRVANSATMISWDAATAPWLDPYDVQLWRNYCYHGTQPTLYTNTFPNPQFTMSAPFAWVLTALSDSAADPAVDRVQKHFAVEFNGSTSGDADGSIVSYAWDFGDGQSNADPIVFHGYNAPGTYYPSLTVTDDAGATASTASRPVVVKDPTQPLNVELLDYARYDELSQDKPLERSVALSPTLRAAFHVEWRQPHTVSLSLISPRNKLITSAVPSPDISYIQNPGSAYYLLDNPAPGLYIMRVETITAPLTTTPSPPPPTPTPTSPYPAPLLSLFVTIADVRPPQGEITIPSATGFTNATNVLLRLSAHDPGNTPGVKAMRFGNDGVKFTDWEMYVPQRWWELPSGDGQDGIRYVYVQFRDAANNESPVYFASIILDTVPPTLTFTPLLTDTMGTGAGGFRWSATDTGLALAPVQYSFYIEGYDSGWAPLTTTTRLDFQDLPSGEYAFWLRAEDLAGNSSAIKQRFSVQR